MSLLEAIVLGIVQGLTEFLPISSTAHLRIVPAFAGWPDPGAAFTAVTQLGTMAAVLLYFREDLPEQLRDEITHFFSIYKDLEQKKVSVDGWYSREDAWKEIEASRERCREFRGREGEQAAH